MSDTEIETAKLTGRILVSELDMLDRAFRQRRADHVREIGNSYSDRTHEIISAWAMSRFPADEVAILEKYGFMQDETFINIRARDESGLYVSKFGFRFPDGKVVRLPSSRGYGCFYMPSAEVADNTGDTPRGLYSLCKDAERDQAAFDKENEAWHGFRESALASDKKPMRHEVAMQFPWARSYLIQEQTRRNIRKEFNERKGRFATL